MLQHPLRLQELEEGDCHHGEDEPPHRRIRARGRLCRELLLPCPRLLPLMEATRLGARGELRAAWGDKQVVLQLWSSFLWRRWQWSDLNEDDREDEESFWSELQKRKSNVCSGGRLCSSILDSCPICGLQCSRFLSNPVTMMGMLDYNSHNDGEIVDDDDDNALISLRWSQYQNSYLDITIWCSL